MYTTYETRRLQQERTRQDARRVDAPVTTYERNRRRLAEQCASKMGR